MFAPMAGYSDAPMRRLVAEHGALWSVTEMLSARGLLAGDHDPALDLARPYPGEADRVLQLSGAEPEVVAAGAALAHARYSPAAIDLNMGCPVPKLRGRGGACLLQTPELADQIVSALRAAVPCGVSVKLRLGWDADHSLDLALALESAGADLLTLHGRTSAQRYEGAADWEAIARVAAAVQVPVVGSGDVVSAELAGQRRQTGVAAVMIGRGAVGNPWLFRQVAGGPDPDPAERPAVALRHAELNAEWYGERRGLRQLRKVLPKYFPEAGSAELRAALVRIETLAELRALLAPLAQAAD